MLRRKVVIPVVKIKLRMNLSMDSVSKPETSKTNVKLEDLSREALIAQLHQSNAHIQQLKNLLAKQMGYLEEEKSVTSYDFSRFKKRHVLLKILYLGWNYHGFAGQNEGVKTVEHEILKALRRSKLIESVGNSNYSRCGRTDKGVSGFSQVISVDLRTNLVEGKGVFTPQNYCPSDKIAKEEIPYGRILNRCLPRDIRVIAWAPVECNINARFDCIRRTYKYYFPKGNLDLKKMEEASQLFLGEHDFRNLCKMNVKNSVVDYKRTIVSINVSTISPCSDGSFQICELTIVGHSFVWHQIRYMVSVLFLVGQGKESPEVVKELLDIDKHPGKPQYPMALDIPLVLFDCEFENVDWQYDLECNKKVIYNLQNYWTEHILKSVIAMRMAESLGDKINIPVGFDNCHLLMGVNSQKHKPLLERNVEETLEEKIERLAKRKKIDTSPINQMQ